MKNVFFLLCLLAGACTTVGPDYKRPEIALPGTFEGTAPGSEGAALPGDWWTLYRDAQLESLVAAAQSYNSDLRFAAARVLEAEGVWREARASLFPEINGSFGYTDARVSSRTVPPPIAGVPLQRPLYQLVASTTFELDFWGRLSRISEAAQANLLGSQYARDVVGLTLAGTVAQTYFGVRSLDAQVRVLDQTIRTRQEALELTRDRLNAGIASELDVHQAQAALSDALVQRRDTVRQRSLLERQLGQLTGKLDLKVPAGDLFALPVPPTPPAGLPSDLLERRPDIRTAEQGLVAANAQIGAARAALFPTISLTGALGAQSGSLSNLLSSGAGIWSLGYALALPIFDAGRREARVEQASAREQQALASYQKAVETGFTEVSQGLINVEQSGATEGDLQDRLTAARNALELSTLRYESGYSPFLEVLDAQRTANDAEIAFVRNRQARLSFSVDLMKALGGGWKAPEPNAQR
jgi:multidrug efflux system outer membrane protein